MPGRYGRAMVETRVGPDGELIEIPPTVLDCGHPYARNVIVGFNALGDGPRVRTYECRTCGQITWDKA